MRKISTLSGLFILLAIMGYSQTGNLTGCKVGANGFVENKGQVIDQNHEPYPTIKFLLCRPGFNIQLRQTGFSYDTYTDSVIDDSSFTIYSKKSFGKNQKNLKRFIRQYHRVDIELVGCNRNAQIIAEEKSTAYFNYLTADAAHGGARDIHYYQRVIYKNIYPHIDLEFCAMQKNPAQISIVPIEYQFIVHPGGNLADIKLTYKGTYKTTLTDNKLILSVTKGDFAESIPNSYLLERVGSSKGANKKPVNVNYISLGNNTFGFSLPNGTALSTDLIIDPVPDLLWGTYYGGISPDFVESTGIALDAHDSVYITGWTNNTSNIATVGAYQTIYAGNFNAFVAKFNPSGSSLLWGTYYGGAGGAEAYGIAVDAYDDAYITGATSSTSGIATKGAYQTNYAVAGVDAFVAKFNSTGDSLLWGTYYGGTSGNGGGTNGTGIAIDANDNIYITGGTNCTSGIATVGAYENTNTNIGLLSVFIAKFNPAGSSLLWGTYYESNQFVWSNGIVVDASNNCYIAGQTMGDSGITTLGAYQPHYTTSNFGNQDNAFVSKFNSSGSSLLWGTYYGGEYETDANGITIDASDNVYITGGTWSSSGIATAGAYQTTFLGKEGSDFNAFVAKLNSSGSSLLWGTYYGGKYNTDATGIVIDSKDNPYITGFTYSTSNIATANAYQTTFGETFVAKFNSSVTCLLWGTYYNSSGSDDHPTTIAIDGGKNVYITGITALDSGVATVGAYQSTNNGSKDVFVAKFDSTDVSTYTILAIPNDTTICEGTSISITASGGINYNWGPASGLSCTGCPNPIATPTTTTTYSVTDSALGCRASSAIVTIKVCAKPNPDITGHDSLCKGYLDNLIATGGTYYKWSNGETGAQYITGPIDGDSTILVIAIDSLGKTGCSDTTLFKIKPLIAPTVTVIPPLIACEGSPVIIQANVTGQGSFSYSWSPGNGSTSTITVRDSNVTYTVNVSNGCDVVDSASLKADIPALSACCNTVIILGGDTIITASGKGIKSYRWEPAEGITCDTCPSITVAPTVTTTYTVIGIDSMDCQVERLVTIAVELPCSRFIVPNVFTPNYAGPYGVNSVLYIPTNNVDTWSLLIYDRWGKEVYKSSNPNQYWTGKTESGGEAPDGVYYYIISVSCQGASYKRDGFVQLIR